MVRVAVEVRRCHDSPLFGEVDLVANAPPELNLSAYAGSDFELRWFSPRTGEFEGSSTILQGGDWVSLGVAPDGCHGTTDLAATVALVPEPTTIALAVAGWVILGILWARPKLAKLSAADQ